MRHDDQQQWWRSAVIYQIYPRSFADSDGDGVGDLEGIDAHLDHLAWLGVDAVWISPFYRSPMADFGYDVADHCSVDPLFGDLAVFDRLLTHAHELGLRVLIDFVGNHTSSAHPWFGESRASRDSPKRDWYIWRDGTADDPPNNWLAAFGGRAWTWEERTRQWYLHLFLPEQPDVNWSNPDVEAAMHDVLRFWLDRGVDGFRADVIHLIGKDPALPDQPPELAHLDLVGVHDHPLTHELLRRIRDVLAGYDGDRMIVGEVNLASADLVAPYYGDRDELHLAFNFSPLRAPWDPDGFADSVERVEAAMNPRDAWPTWVLSNHDNRRHRTRYGGSEARARTAAVLLLTLRGTPFLYQGEELGLEDAHVPPERQVDPGGRDGCRAPLPWTTDAGHGWPGDPWLPWPPEPAARSVEAQRRDPQSMLHLYRRLLTVRRSSPALQTGSYTTLPAPHGVVAYLRQQGADRRAVAVNFTDAEQPVAVAGDWVVEVTSTGKGEALPWAGHLPGGDAVILRPQRS